ncbi:MAG: hypothetical protein AB7G28_19885 [Pirellulales bacterium]
MSQPDSESTRPGGILVRRPSSNIYTALLGVAVAAMTLGCLFLLLEIHQYGPIWTTPWNK